MSKVRIVLDKHFHGKIWIDDKEIHDVRAIEFKSSVGDLNRVCLELIPACVELESSETAIVDVTPLDNDGSRLFRKIKAA